MSLTQRGFQFRGDHPILIDHFPGHPIIPGALLLDLIVDEIQRAVPEFEIVGLKDMKFLAPLKADIHAELLIETRENTLEFRLTQSGSQMAKGCFRVRPLQAIGL